eukprot:TRINITY_DN4032_c0_g1_i1.p1 TRINITY_DN4032_c0_g1~~TRINITY_DN4032_c0_g1_i1.p1  ORF type:complete len:331 (-),score=26.49 TRINITY_DN4032_c0_g1_i1:502-1494(-)
MNNNLLAPYSQVGKLALVSMLGRGFLNPKIYCHNSTGSEYLSKSPFCSLPQKLQNDLQLPQQIHRIRHDFLDLHPKSNTKQKDLYVIACNYTLPRATPPIWHNAMFRLCADGGANRIYEQLPHLVQYEEEEDNPGLIRSRYRPDMIKGDLDSIHQNVRDFYEGLGVEVIDRSFDQSTTDLEKCIRCLQNKFDREGIVDYRSVQIAVLGGLGGRVDHMLANIHLLHTYSHLQVILFGSESICRLIQPGRNIIQPIMGIEGPACGVVPLRSSARVSTQGLKFDMQDTLLEFGVFISTSNSIAEEEIVIETDNELLWSVEVREDNFLKRLTEP